MGRSASSVLDKGARLVIFKARAAKSMRDVFGSGSDGSVPRGDHQGAPGFPGRSFVVAFTRRERCLMARRLRSSSREFGRADRRKTAWDLGPGGGSIATFEVAQLTSSTSAVLGTGVTPLIPNLTIARIRGMVNLSLITADAARAGYTYCLGIGIVTSDAFSTGVSAMPNPFDDADWPGWIWHQFGVLRSAVAAITVSGEVPDARIEIDAKAMRKFRTNEVLFGSVQVGETVNAAIDVAMATRLLVMLP